MWRSGWGKAAAEGAQPTEAEVSLFWRNGMSIVHTECKPQGPRSAEVRLIAPESTRKGALYING